MPVLGTVSVLYRRNPVMKVSKRLLTFLLVFILGISAVSPVLAQSTASKPVAIAAASDLQFALPEISAAYTHKTGNTVVVTYGSSGNLSSQIANGAPFDVLLSADASYPRQLIASGNANSSSLTFYARGSLAVWFGPGVDLGNVPPSIQALETSSIRNIAIANPKHAPYGRAAEAALKSAGIYDRVAKKLVLGENIAQAIQFVDSGNAQAGLVALSLLIGSKHAGAWKVVPIDSYPALDQAAVVTKRGDQNAASQKFIDFLKSPEAQAIFQRYGFREPSPESQK
jgi:molybdate transport system substrate-binding protein